MNWKKSHLLDSDMLDASAKGYREGVTVVVEANHEGAVGGVAQTRFRFRSRHVGNVPRIRRQLTLGHLGTLLTS